MPAGASPPDLTALLHHADWVHRLALRLCADEHSAADAEQDTWTLALQRPPRRADNLQGWLGTLLRRSIGMRARSERRRAAREAAPVPATLAEAAVETVARADLHRHLAALVLELAEPQRTLVLLHYFEGHEVAALAQRFRLSADAVRGHLRRAREVLRERLQRSEPDMRRAFGALLATTIPTMTMAISTKVLLGLGTVAATVLLWVWPVPSPAGPAAPGGAPPDVAAASGSAATPREPGAANERAALAPAVARTLTVRLDGLHRDVPWTTRVHVDIEGMDAASQQWRRQDEALEVGADACARSARPAWLDAAASAKVRLRGDDPFYLPFSVTLRDDEVRGRDQFVVPVQVTGVLTGRVVDFTGAPVAAARVVAFPAEFEQSPDRLGQTDTDTDGRYELRVPPATALLLTATAMQEASLSGRRIVGDHGAVTDNGVLRHDLLPAATRIAAVAGQRTEVLELRLAPAAQLTGRVLFRDGTPVVGASVHVWPDGARTLGLDDDVGLQLRPDDTLTPVARVATDADGRFALAARLGARVAIGVTGVRDHMLCGDVPLVWTTAPAPVQIELPPPITVRARRDGQLLAGTRFELPFDQSSESADSVLRLLLVAPTTTLRCRHGTLRSASVELRAADAGTAIDLELNSALAPVAIELRGDAPVRQARFRFEPLQGGEPLQELLHRDDRGEPFRLFVAPGRYRLHVRAAPGEHNGLFLLPQLLELEVDAAGGQWTLPARFGGRIRIAVTDANGLFLGGRHTLRDAAGTVLTGLLMVRRSDGTLIQATPGELMPGGVNETADLLEPGEYVVELDLGAHGIERRRVTVTAREMADVLVRVR